MMRQKGIRDISREAKERLCNGFWQERKEARALSVAIDEVAAAQILLKVDETAEEDPLFLKKVTELVDNEGFICNPIRLLMDDDRMEGLDYEGRQRYIFRLSERYATARARILRERRKEPFSG